MTPNTKDRILDTAQRLFADEGVGVTSLRDITKEAEVNLAAVNYHFGSKEELLKAILERNLRPINNERIALLDKLHNKNEGTSPAIEDILSAFLGPPFYAWAALDTTEEKQKGLKFLRFLGQCHSASEEVRASLFNQFDQVVVRYTEALQKALPNLEPDEVKRRMEFTLGAMSHTMILFELTATNESDQETPKQLFESLIRFAAAGFSTSKLQTTSKKTLSKKDKQQ
tara:strand:- start:896 stop:1576 length:681 start_codon:yes stop_codon:yes gene_type:complete